jgi:lysyl-tRNA synthetase class 2
MDLNNLKKQASLNNKQWDKTIKGITKLGAAKFTKTNDAFAIEFRFLIC